ncbi:esterase-like activity of phytase family protein [Pseudomonas abieticivorans]|uniref:esterase-like activity of phytase family protein n=1 Tax=Pseudomonas abieticivorans TaxID=2931382 RepID=UPI0020C05D4B|nr:esterase-like activity of phytase family protein [Pseudomonas sp. PIA16]
MRLGLAALLLIALPALAQPVPELKLLSEHPVDGMRGGNLSGLAMCGDRLWTESDRDDDLIYRLDTSDTVWKAENVHIDVPPVPDTGLPLMLRAVGKAASVIRGGVLDFEGITCDAKGNRYLVSEGFAAVLQVPVDGAPNWLKIDPSVIQEAHAKGLLRKFNAIFEGLAINAAGDQLWLAAEREHRGILSVRKRADGSWGCLPGTCILLNEGGTRMQPSQFPTPKLASRDFSDVSLYKGKLYTLERNVYQICRRDAKTAVLERCWSYAGELLTTPRQYAQEYGLEEALVIDADGAWVGVDNNEGARNDGEKRPIVWRFAAPDGGWEQP